MDRTYCYKIVDEINDMIEDEAEADKEYTELIERIRKLKPEGETKIIQELDAMAGDEIRHRYKLIEIRDKIRRHCEWL